MGKDYETMTLEELLAENDRLWAIRQEAKQKQAELQPYLDAAWEDKAKADAAKADPTLTQGIGGG